MATTIRGQEASDYPEDPRFMADEQPLPHDEARTDLVTALRRAQMPVIEADVFAEVHAELEALRARAANAEQDAADAHAYADEVERSFEVYQRQAEASIERLATALRAVTAGAYHVGGRYIADEELATLARERMVQSALRDIERWAASGTRAALAQEVA